MILVTNNVKKKVFSYHPHRPRPNRSRVGAIDIPDRPEQDFDQYDIPEDPENFHERLFDRGP